MLDEADLREQPEPEGPEPDEEMSSGDGLPESLERILIIDGNLLPHLENISDCDVETIKARVTDGYGADKESMKDYIDRYTKITNLASMKPEVADKTFPFQGASKIMMQYLAQAAIDFNSRTTPDIVNRKDIATVYMWGGESVDKQARANRVASSINWWLKKGIRGWAQMKDRGLLLLPVQGMYFNKIWWADNKINESLITADKMVFDHDADSFEEAPRKSHGFSIEYNQYVSMVREGQWEPIDALDREKENTDGAEVDKPLRMVESHCTIDLDCDGYAEPYIVTWSEDYDEIVRIERRFLRDDVEVKDGVVVEISGEEFFVQHGFIPNIEKPAIFDGWGTLLYTAFEQLNTLNRMAIDATTLNITAMNSGFISSSVRAPGRSKSGRIELIMGQLTKVESGNGVGLKEQIWTPPFNGLSQGFFALLESLKNDVMKYCSASQTMDVKSGEAASLYLARLQQAMKVPNAIMSRVYNSQSKEFTRVYDLEKRYIDQDTYMEIIDWHPSIPIQVQLQYDAAVEQYKAAMQQSGGQLQLPPPEDPVSVAMKHVSRDEDFADSLEIITTADPTSGSAEERMYRAEMVTKAAGENPDLYNKYEAHRQLLREIGAPDIEVLLNKPSGKPDPMTQAQLEWTKADAIKKEAQAQKLYADTQIAMVDNHIDQRGAALRDEKHHAEIENIQADTMQKLNGIDMTHAEMALAIEQMVHEHAMEKIGGTDKGGKPNLKIDSDYQTNVAEGQQGSENAAPSATPESGTYLGYHPKFGHVTAHQSYENAAKYASKPVKND